MKFFTINELTRSSTALRKKINNSPTEEVKNNLIELVDKILDPVREKWGKPIIVSSGYRCPTLNVAVGGAKNSQHTTGEAADIHTVEDTVAENKKLFEVIKSRGLPFNKLIKEYNYNRIHVSYSSKHKPRKQILSIK